MNSIILCEGRDDLWFIAYYLNKTNGWTPCNRPGKFFPYKISPLSEKQSVEFFSKNEDCVAIWSVSGKDAIPFAISTILDKLVADLPMKGPESIVLVRDKDNDDEKDVLTSFEECFSKKVHLNNTKNCVYHDIVDDEDVNINITPLIIPFDRNGAIETLLLNAIRESSDEGEIIANEAETYIDRLLAFPNVGKSYLKKDRLILKARYSAAVAVTNPDHSTALFQGMVMSCPWEKSEYVKRHFDIIVNAITSENAKYLKACPAMRGKFSVHICESADGVSTL